MIWSSIPKLLHFEIPLGFVHFRPPLWCPVRAGKNKRSCFLPHDTPKVEITSQLSTITMTNHLDRIEAEFRRELAKNDTESLVSWVKERILESFKNGQGARPRSTVKPDQTKAGVK